MSDSEKFVRYGVDADWNVQRPAPGLPGHCYVVREDRPRGSRVHRVTCGGFSVGIFDPDPRWSIEAVRRWVHQQNAALGVNPVQAAAMQEGLLHGWAVPAANPATYGAAERARLETERAAALLLV